MFCCICNKKFYFIGNLVVYFFGIVSLGIFQLQILYESFVKVKVRFIYFFVIKLESLIQVQYYVYVSEQDSERCLMKVMIY